MFTLEYCIKIKVKLTLLIAWRDGNGRTVIESLCKQTWREAVMLGVVLENSVTGTCNTTAKISFVLIKKNNVYATSRRRINRKLLSHMRVLRQD